MNELRNIAEEELSEEKSRDTLRNIPLFSQLSIENFRAVSAISRLVRFKKKETLFRAGEHYKGFYIILKGTVKIFKISPEGKEIVVHLFSPFNSFAEMPLFEGNDYPVNAVALEDSLLMFIPKESFVQLIKSHPEISLKMLAGFSKRMKYLVDKIEDLSSKEVINRVAKFLLQEIENNRTVNLPEPFLKLSASKATVASLVGTVTETFSRALHKLQMENIIRVHNKTIFILNLKKLKKLATE